MSTESSKNKYIRIVHMPKGKPVTSKMISPENLKDFEHPENEGMYASLSYYNEDHVNMKSVQGIKDLVTDKIWFDFDLKDDIAECKKETLELIDRLKSNNINEKNLEVFFSGQKGFHIIVNLKREIPTTKVKNIAIKLAKGFKSFDLKVYDEARILRLPFTQHAESKLYKIPLTINELKTLSIDDIKEKAKDLSWAGPDLRPKGEAIELTDDLLKEEEAPKKEETKLLTNIGDPLMFSALDIGKRPQGWKDYKWAIAQGRFAIGERHNAMMVLASTCKAMYYSIEQAQGLMEASNLIHCQITGDSVKTDEIEKSLRAVYNDGWRGGQYSPQNDLYLKQYCEQNGFQKEVSVSKTLTITEAIDSWREFENLSDSFKVVTRIESLDRKAKMTIGTVNSILGAPATGKTSIVLQILNNMSRAGHRGIFFSYDMYLSLVIRKLLQRHTKGDETSYNLKRADYISRTNTEVAEILEREYKNVSFCTESGQSCNDIIDTLQRERDRVGENINFIMIDYNELIKSDKADSTESSKDVAIQLRNIANNFNVCVIVLNQPSKMAGSPADEITSYRAIKGSSMIEQSMDLVLAISRPGYNFSGQDEDQFMVINAVKNRHGSPFRLELVWDGYNGLITDQFTDEQRILLCNLKDRLKNEPKIDDFGSRLVPGRFR